MIKIQINPVEAGELGAVSLWSERKLRSMVPPSAHFPYWTFYHLDKDADGLHRAEFIHTDQIYAIDARSEEVQEEVTQEDDIRHSKMPSVLRDYRDITS